MAVAYQAACLLTSSSPWFWRRASRVTTRAGSRHDSTECWRHLHRSPPVLCAGCALPHRLQRPCPELVVLSQHQQKRLEVVHNKAMKTMLGAPRWCSVCGMQIEICLTPPTDRVRLIMACWVARVLLRYAEEASNGDNPGQRRTPRQQVDDTHLQDRCRPTATALEVGRGRPSLPRLHSSSPVGSTLRRACVRSRRYVTCMVKDKRRSIHTPRYR